jgi:AmmeMemoRadiSam system protein A
LEHQFTYCEQRLLLSIARRAICERLGLVSTLPDLPATEALQAPAGAFVTLRAGKRLRGCIGHITAEQPLRLTVAEVAVSSAFEDPRFPPLGPTEIDRIVIEVSVLSRLRVASRPEDVTPGVHGVLVRRGLRSGLLLPQVATEQGWGRVELLDHTCRKAGLPPECWREPGTVIEVFQATVFSEAQR